jgi:hypothetical protein
MRHVAQARRLWQALPPVSQDASKNSEYQMRWFPITSTLNAPLHM